MALACGCGDDSTDGDRRAAATGAGVASSSGTAEPTASTAAGQGDGGTGLGGGGGGPPSGSGGGGGGAVAACETTFDEQTLHLAVGTALAPGEERTMCLRWTAPEDLEIVGLEGTLGPAAGHHALVLVHPTPSGEDGVSPCSEADLMDQNLDAGFQMIAGVSYESDGVRYGFPSAPVQLGLSVKKGQQLVLDGHFLNAGSGGVEACASVDFELGDVFVPLTFRTVLPVEEYDLVVPANGSVDVTYEEPIGASYRVAAASSHMHQGGRHFRMSVAETGITLFEGEDWADPVPRQFDGEALVIAGDHTFRLECSFVNTSNAERRFPDEMCVGGLYLVPCSFPGACPG